MEQTTGIAGEEFSRLVTRREKVLAELAGIDKDAAVGDTRSLRHSAEFFIHRAELERRLDTARRKAEELEARLVRLDRELAALPGEALGKLFEALKKNPLLAFEGLDVVADARTGLVWPEPKAYVEKYGGAASLDAYAAREFTKSLKIGAVGGWRLPEAQELKEIYALMGDSMFADLATGFAWHMDELGCVSYLPLSEEAEGELNYTYPCSDVLAEVLRLDEEAGDWETAWKERLVGTLEVFGRARLKLVFDGPDQEELKRIYGQLFVRRGELIAELGEIERDLAACGEGATLADAFTRLKLAEKYNASFCDASLVTYYSSIASWSGELLGFLDRAAEEKKGLFEDLGRIAALLRPGYVGSARLSEEENALLAKRLEHFRKVVTADLDQVRRRLTRVKKSAASMLGRVEAAFDRDDPLWELAGLHAENRAPFRLVVESATELVRRELKRLDYCGAAKDALVKACAAIESWTDDYTRFRTKGFEEFQAVCAAANIADEVWMGWFRTWQELRFEIESSLLPLLDWGLRQGEAGADIAVVWDALSLLESFKRSLDSFYLEERRGIYYQYALINTGSDYDRLETEKALAKCKSAFREGIEKLLAACSAQEQRLFIRGWAEEIVEL